ncbi:hypothetical protein K3U93_19810 [Mycobacterium malmoense]|nr:hypothetical protein [Mycobacterium malmoense]QZA16852.1 hypothetical protein K3U93_19810 [Mycobacterium malmoense]UNB93647.1 hypothetical protein H5T25_19785 [Mycobacterium malmoense]
MQQVAANGVSYGDLYVSTWQTAAKTAVNYFTGTAATQFQGWIQKALTALISGNVTGMVTDFYEALYAEPLITIGLPLAKILNIPEYITQNLANATKYLALNGVTAIGSDGIVQLGNQIQEGLGPGLQAVYNAWNAGNTLGALTNLVNTPGAVTNTFLNGFGSRFGLLSSPAFVRNGTGLLNITNSIVAPNAINISICFCWCASRPGVERSTTRRPMPAGMTLDHVHR